MWLFTTPSQIWEKICWGIFNASWPWAFILKYINGQVLSGPDFAAIDGMNVILHSQQLCGKGHYALRQCRSRLIFQYSIISEAVPAQPLDHFNT